MWLPIPASSQLFLVLAFSFLAGMNLAFCSRTLCSRTLLWSLSSLSLVITTLLGWMPTGTLVPLAFSHCVHSMLMMYSCKPGVPGPCAGLYGLLAHLHLIVLAHGHGPHGVLLSQLLAKGKDIILWMWEGSLKCLFWFLLRSEVTKELTFTLATAELMRKDKHLMPLLVLSPPFISFVDGLFFSYTNQNYTSELYMCVCVLFLIHLVVCISELDNSVLDVLLYFA